jgi:iron complex transport system substrate-binding protein
LKKCIFKTLCIAAVFWIFPTITPAAETITVSDEAGRQVTVPFDPNRIIALGPGSLRLMVYLQAESKIAGVENMEKRHPGGRPYWFAHPELSKLPSCGPGGPASINKKPDMEAILSVKPEVIFVTYMESALADQVQRSLGIPVVVLSYGESVLFDKAVYDSLRIAGKILNREKRADQVVSYIESLRDDMRSRTANTSENSKPLVYIGGVGHRGAQGIESTENRYIPFEWIGADNAAKQIEAGIGSHVAMDKELLLQLNPDIIFIDDGGLALVKEDYRKKPKYYKALKAFSTQQIYALLPFNWYATNIDTALADAYTVGKILNAEQFSDVDPQAKADEIYTFLVGKPVYKNLEKEHGAIGRKIRFVN